MELSTDDVAEILNLVDRASGIAHLEVRLGDTHIVVSQHGPPGVAPSAAGVSPPAAAQPDITPPGPAPASAPAAETGEPRSKATDASEADEGLVAVTAPVVGVFYRAPEPGAEPFVEIGSQVEEDTTVGLVEVMKMFNSVTAGTRGTVQRIVAANEAFVEYGETLLLIEPGA